MKIIFDIFNPTDKLTFLKHHFYKKKQKKTYLLGSHQEQQ